MHARFDSSIDSEDSEDSRDGKPLKQYWETIRAKYLAHTPDPTTLSLDQADKLPANWTVINISVTEDKSTMFVSRQRPNTEPLIFCVPLKGRRESDEDEHLTFDDTLDELKEIIRLSDEGTRRAMHVKCDDQQARASWWAERGALDKRLKELLENIEFCWLGAFKVRPVDGYDLY
jgi:separase